MTSVPFTIRARAARDLSGHAEWLRQQADDALAERFLFAAQESFHAVAAAPGLGGPADSKLGELTEARKWRVEGFANYLIFYAPRSRDGITILRVLHAARDWKKS